MKNVIIALLSGAIGGSIITVLFDYFKMKRSYLREQIDKLYGPLYNLLSYSSQTFEIANSILREHARYFSGNKWSQDKSTQEKLKNESLEVIEISNKYVNEANRTNEKIFEILQNNYSLLDLDDIGVVNCYMKNFSRLRVEYAGNKKLPFIIYKKIGDIAFLPKDFKFKIMEKFDNKKNKLDNPCISFKKLLKRAICSQNCN